MLYKTFLSCSLEQNMIYKSRWEGFIVLPLLYTVPISHFEWTYYTIPGEIFRSVNKPLPRWFCYGFQHISCWQCPFVAVIGWLHFVCVHTGHGVRAGSWGGIWHVKAGEDETLVLCVSSWHVKAGGDGTLVLCVSSGHLCLHRAVCTRFTSWLLAL